MKPIVIGVSGPDGAGKSSLVADARERLAQAGRPSASTYLYGCVICRRAAHRDGLPRASAELAHWIGPVHAIIDAAELGVRLRMAEIRLGRTARDRDDTPVLLTDRTPYDGLAKFGPRVGPLGRWLYRRFAGRYDRVFLLVSDPAILAARDGDHAPGELAGLLARFDIVTDGQSRVDRVETTDLDQQTLCEQLIAVT